MGGGPELILLLIIVAPVAVIWYVVQRVRRH